MSYSLNEDFNKVFSCNTSDEKTKYDIHSKPYQVMLRQNDKEYISNISYIVATLKNLRESVVRRIAEQNNWNLTIYKQSTNPEDYKVNTEKSRSYFLGPTSTTYILLTFSTKMFFRNFINDWVEDRTKIAMVYLLCDSKSSCKYNLVLKNTKPYNILELNEIVKKWTFDPECYNKYGKITTSNKISLPQNISEDSFTDDKYLNRDDFSVCFNLTKVRESLENVTAYDWFNLLKKNAKAESVLKIKNLPEDLIEIIKSFIKSYHIKRGSYQDIDSCRDLPIVFSAVIGEILARAIESKSLELVFWVPDLERLLYMTKPKREYDAYKLWIGYIKPNLEELGIEISDFNSIKIPENFVEILKKYQVLTNLIKPVSSEVF